MGPGRRSFGPSPSPTQPRPGRSQPGNVRPRRPGPGTRPARLSPASDRLARPHRARRCLGPCQTCARPTSPEPESRPDQNMATRTPEQQRALRTAYSSPSPGPSNTRYATIAANPHKFAPLFAQSALARDGLLAVASILRAATTIRSELGEGKAKAGATSPVELFLERSLSHQA